MSDNVTPNQPSFINPPPLPTSPIKKEPVYKSRTFWFSLIWVLFVPAGIAVQILYPSIKIPLDTIIPISGTISMLFVGGEKVRDSMSITGFSSVQQAHLNNQSVYNQSVANMYSSPTGYPSSGGR